jgi:UDP-2-acetamido-3-amino-2,3-dideoxy-glucuronate N-acetyltransferase
MIYPTAEVQSKNIGKDANIWQYVVILKGARIGDNCNISCHCYIENDVIIKNNVTIKSGVQIWDGVVLEENVFIGPNVTFTNDLIPRSKSPFTLFKTLIKEGASIGANSTIVAGNIIGEFSFVGAGSVITRNVPPFTVWYGNPARHRGYITREGIILNMELKDKNGNKYNLKNFEPFPK